MGNPTTPGSYIVVSATGREIGCPTMHHAVSCAIKMEYYFELVRAIRTPDGVCAGDDLRRLIGEAPDPKHRPFPMGGPIIRDIVGAEEYRDRKADILRRHKNIAFGAS